MRRLLKIAVTVRLSTEKQASVIRGGVCRVGWSLSASNRMLPGPRPTFVLSGILTHPDIWPQHIWAENWGLYAPLGEEELGAWVPM